MPIALPLKLLCEHAVAAARLWTDSSRLMLTKSCCPTSSIHCPFARRVNCLATVISNNAKICASFPMTSRNCVCPPSPLTTYNRIQHQNRPVAPSPSQWHWLLSRMGRPSSAISIALGLQLSEQATAFIHPLPMRMQSPHDSDMLCSTVRCRYKLKNLDVVPGT